MPTIFSRLKNKNRDLRIRPFVLFARWSAGEGTGFPIWSYGQNVQERLPHAAYKADRGSFKAIEKLREEGRGEKRRTLSPFLPTTSFLTRQPLPCNQFLTRPNSLSV